MAPIIRLRGLLIDALPEINNTKMKLIEACFILEPLRFRRVVTGRVSRISKENKNKERFKTI
jgi:hypothetical protein